MFCKFTETYLILVLWASDGYWDFSPTLSDLGQIPSSAWASGFSSVQVCFEGQVRCDTQEFYWNPIDYNCKDLMIVIITTF